ncbi:MAG: hypothetical protein JSS20_22020, partial [Proteobacteria bacterium]|nr:hypothetical protein [Pseudomonadota bacterium]
NSMGAETGAKEYLYALPTATVAAGVAGSVVPWRIPSIAKASLPTLRSADAGALSYVPDATSGATVACWDGSAWKVIAALGATVT